MIILLIILVIVAVIVFNETYKYFVFDVPLKNVPGPKRLPVLRNTLAFGNKTLLELITNWFDKFGDTFQYEILFFPKQIFTCDVDLVQFILTSPKLLEKGYSYKFLYNWVGEGLITSGNPRWKNHRKLITPSFHFKMLEYFLNTFNLFGDHLKNSLKKQIDSETIDVLPLISVHTLNMICNSAMGTRVNADKKFQENFNDVCRVVMKRVTSPIKAIQLTYFFTSDYKTEKQALDSMHKYTDLVITSRREQLKQNPELLDKTMDNQGIKKRISFLDTLLKQQAEFGNLSNQYIREEVHTFMAAGYETTASSISYVLYNLAQFPEVQEKVVEELRSVFADEKTKAPTTKDLKNMKYLDMVIKETLRLYPVAPMISRMITENTTFGKYTFPKGHDLVISIFNLHRSPKLYENPLRFDPERFTPENVSKRPPYAFIPFSGGARNCIGQKYGILAVKSVIAKILRNFEVLKSPKDKGLHELTGDLVLRSVHGIHIRVKPRVF